MATITKRKKKIGVSYQVQLRTNGHYISKTFKDLKKVLDYNHKDVEWVSASRLRREKYTIKGSDGKLKFKIGENAFPSQVVESL